jgi:hypothetical protein
MHRDSKTHSRLAIWQPPRIWRSASIRDHENTSRNNPKKVSSIENAAQVEEVSQAETAVALQAGAALEANGAILDIYA